MDPLWLIFAAANGFGNHQLRIGIMHHGISRQSQIPRARGTVSQVPADGFSLMLSQVGSIVQRNTTGTWLRTLLDRRRGRQATMGDVDDDGDATGDGATEYDNNDDGDGLQQRRR